MNHIFDVACWELDQDSVVIGSWCMILGNVLLRQMLIDCLVVPPVDDEQQCIHCCCRDHVAVVEKVAAYYVAVADVDDDASSVVVVVVGSEMVHDIVNVVAVMVIVAVESSHYPPHILCADVDVADVIVVGMDDYYHIAAAVGGDACYYDAYYRLTRHDYTVICSPLQ